MRRPVTVAGEGAVTAVRGGSSTIASASCHPGQSLGRYRVVEKIGCGGFGAVYRAIDPVLRRDVAIKTCEVTSLEVRARFEREARLAARLRHPSITTVYDFGFEANVPFLVCEFLEGADLDEVFARFPELPLLERLDVLIAVAGALECEHGAGVHHRDIKPANVRVLPDGTVKLMDFGIAKLFAWRREELAAARSAEHRRAQAVRWALTGRCPESRSAGATPAASSSDRGETSPKAAAGELE